MKCSKCSQPIELVTRKNEDGMFYNFWNCDDCGKTLPVGMDSFSVKPQFTITYLENLEEDYGDDDHYSVGAGGGGGSTHDF
jgi:hypothetical protein